MTRKTRRRVALAGLGLSATLLQLYPTGCGQYYANALVQAFNFCGALNCTSSTYFDLCAPTVILVDCPTTPTVP